MGSKHRAGERRMAGYLLVNLLLAVVLRRLFQPFASPWHDAALAFLAVAAVITLMDRRYARYLWYGATFILYLVEQIILGNLAVARLVLQPHPKLDLGIVAVPLDVDTGFEITALASAITLTPGTLTIDLKRDSQGRPVLYIHALVVKEPEKLRAAVKGGLERMILRVSRAY